MAVDDAVDKEKFTAAIFRRGNKQELFSGAGDSDTAGNGHGSDHAPTGDEKLDELLKLWSLPRSGYVPCMTLTTACVQVDSTAKPIEYVRRHILLMQEGFISCDLEA